jgi:hypothetical protein
MPKNSRTAMALIITNTITAAQPDGIARLSNAATIGDAIQNMITAISIELIRGKTARNASTEILTIKRKNTSLI